MSVQYRQQGDQAFGGLPSVTVDPTIRTANGRCHSSEDTYPDLPTKDHLEKGMSMALAVIDGLQPVIPCVAHIGISYELGDVNAAMVSMRTKVVLVEPLTKRKADIQATMLFSYKPQKGERPVRFTFTQEVKEAVDSLRRQAREEIFNGEHLRLTESQRLKEFVASAEELAA